MWTFDVWFQVQKIQCLTPNIGVVYRFLFILQLSGKLGYSVLLVGDILDLINMHIALNCLKIKSATISVFCQCLKQVPVHVHLWHCWLTKQGVQKEHRKLLTWRFISWSIVEYSFSKYRLSSTWTFFVSWNLFLF